MTVVGHNRTSRDLYATHLFPKKQAFGECTYIAAWPPIANDTT
jgi:hypothetical protein